MEIIIPAIPSTEIFENIYINVEIRVTTDTTASFLASAPEAINAPELYFLPLFSVNVPRTILATIVAIIIIAVTMLVLISSLLKIALAELIND